MVQIQPTKPVPNHAEYTAPRCNISQIIQIRNLSALKDVDREAEIDL